MVRNLGIEAINSKQMVINFARSEKDSEYKIHLVVDSVKRCNKTKNLMGYGYYYLILNKRVAGNTVNEYTNYHALIGEVLCREQRIASNYPEEEHLLEYQAYTFSELTESELLCFYPELVEYQDLDSRYAFSITPQKAYNSVYGPWEERAHKNPQLYKRYKNIPNPGFAVRIADFFKTKAMGVSCNTYYQNPTQSTSDLGGHTVDVACKASTVEEFKALQTFFKPIAGRTEIHPATKELVIKSTNVNIEELQSFADNTMPLKYNIIAQPVANSYF